MEWPIILALVLGIPVLLFPVAYVWYLNIGGLYGAIKKARKTKAAYEERAKAVAEKRPAVAGAQEPAAKGELVGTPKR